MNRLFGTDGIRAVAGKYPLDYSTVYQIGKNLTDLLKQENLSPYILIGRDTRSSGEWIQKALFQGIRDSRGKAVCAGVIPTSAIAVLSKIRSFSSGIVISASHNPYEYNGIKIFSSEGIKIKDSFERKLESLITKPGGKIIPDSSVPLPSKELKTEYMKFLKSKFPYKSLSQGIKVAVDCANGASSNIAPDLFSNLGFNTLPINHRPDGKNINSNCGSLFPNTLATKVLEAKADLGVAFDGDSDRAIFVDEKGKVLNGDHTLFILSNHMKEKGLLKSNKIIGTVMSNLGLEKTLKEIGLQLIRTDVGDRYVYEEMLKQNSNLGGEQSGHTIILNDCPTGDGILTSLKVIQAMILKDRPLSDLHSGLYEYPQIQKNVKISRKEDFGNCPEIMKAIQKAEHELMEKGRVNVRYSGTEPVARLMIEGENKEQIEKLGQMIAESISKELA
ncbi:MAG: phosphoglucosamine mutase [Candidatus Aminicenantes bacterium]|nr:phosphoglucosamine mutase [Candidatus Aminicenantes bacterium]